MTRQDLYAILGVARNASPQEIKKAYRRLAQKYHPDRNPENKKAEERFKEISVAHDILSDPDKRQLYDEFGMEALQSGFDPGRARAYRRAAAGPGGYATGDLGAGWSQGNRSFSDILNEMFSGLGRQARVRMDGRHLRRADGKPHARPLRRRWRERKHRSLNTCLSGVCDW